MQVLQATFPVRMSVKKILQHSLLQDSIKSCSSDNLKCCISPTFSSCDNGFQDKWKRVDLFSEAIEEKKRRIDDHSILFPKAKSGKAAHFNHFTEELLTKRHSYTNHCCCQCGPEIRICISIYKRKNNSM